MPLGVSDGRFEFLPGLLSERHDPLRGAGEVLFDPGSGPREKSRSRLACSCSLLEPSHLNLSLWGAAGCVQLASAGSASS